MIINIVGMWEDARLQHTTYIHQCINNFILECDNNPILQSSPHRREVLAFIKRSRHMIASPERTDFSCLIAVFEKQFPKKSDLRAKSLDLFQKIFTYADFSDKATPGWNAYRLCEKMKLQVCPYCHIQDTETAIPDPGTTTGYRPQLDHYYSQAEYPFLALSLGNLIPCCAQCNGPGFKHTKNFYTTPHPHPGADSENIRFTLVSKDQALKGDVLVENLREPKELYQIEVTCQIDSEKSKNAISTFQLFNRYQPKIAEAYRIAKEVKKRSTRRTQSSREQMCAQEGLPRDDDGILNFEPNDIDHYKSRSIGKMSRDIYYAAIKRWP